MKLKLLLLTNIALAFSITLYSQNSISINTEYSIGELSSKADFENCYNLSFDYNTKLKEWLTWNIGLYGQNENFISGGTYSSFGDVIVNGNLLENVSRTMRAEGKAKTLLVKSGVQFHKHGFSASPFGGFGMSSMSSTWKYRIAQNGIDLNNQSFVEDYESSPTWLLGIQLAYKYPITDKVKIGVSCSGSVLKSSERSISSTKGSYVPEEYYNPELSRRSATNYSESYIFSGIIIEILL